MRQPYRVITRRRTRHLQKSRGPFQDPCNALVSHRVFRSLNGTSPDDFPRRFGLEHHRLFGEGISTFACLSGGLLDDHELCKARNEEHAVFLSVSYTHLTLPTILRVLILVVT